MSACKFFYIFSPIFEKILNSQDCKVKIFLYCHLYVTIKILSRNSLCVYFIQQST